LNIVEDAVSFFNSVEESGWGDTRQNHLRALSGIFKGLERDFERVVYQFKPLSEAGGGSLGRGLVSDYARDVWVTKTIVQQFEPLREAGG
jgi:hypothetical protein